MSCRVADTVKVLLEPATFLALLLMVVPLLGMTLCTATAPLVVLQLTLLSLCRLLLCCTAYVVTAVLTAPVA